MGGRVRARRSPGCGSGLWAQEWQLNATHIHIGHAFKGSHSQPFMWERLGVLLGKWQVLPYLWEAPKTAFILFFYQPTTAIID